MSPYIRGHAYASKALADDAIEVIDAALVQEFGATETAETRLGRRSSEAAVLGGEATGTWGAYVVTPAGIATGLESRSGQLWRVAQVPRKTWAQAIKLRTGNRHGVPECPAVADVAVVLHGSPRVVPPGLAAKYFVKAADGKIDELDSLP